MGGFLPAYPAHGRSCEPCQGLDIDWAALSSDWRDLYRFALDQVIVGQRPWLRVNRLHREVR